MRAKILVLAVLAISLPPLAAQAHWCNDMWQSSYNIVVRPASDTVTVPSSASASLDIFVQNNMGYLLPSFKLTATMTSGTITATRQTQKVAGTLLPGEKAKYTLAITKSGGGSVTIDSISFAVSFGSGQSGMYGQSPGKAVMIRKAADGSLVPSASPPPGLTSDDQSRQLQYAAQTDFSDVSSGLDTLMNYYCAGRGSWNSQSDAVLTPACTGAATDCTKATSTMGTGAGTKWQYPHLWAALELVARKSGLGDTRIATLRQRLQCGAADPNPVFAGFAMMMLGYLGDDTGARTFLVGKAGGTGDLATVAKAALLVAGNSADKTTYEAAVKTGSTTGSTVVKAACAAALGIAELDDATVTSSLVPLAQWTEPDTSDNGQGLYASYLLSLVAWDRRCWAAKAGDTGAVSFYEGGTPARCTSAGGTPTGGNTATGGSTGAGGSPGMGGTTATGGKTGGSTGAGGTTATGGTAVTGGKTAASGGTTGTPGGGTTGSPGGGTTGSPGAGTTAAAGGTTSKPVGGTTGTPGGGNPDTGPAMGGNAGGSSLGGGAGGGLAVDTGGSTGTSIGGQPGTGGASSSVTASNSGSASGCGYAPSGRATIPLGFVLAGMGLALAVRRRRRR